MRLGASCACVSLCLWRQHMSLWVICQGDLSEGDVEKGTLRSSPTPGRAGPLLPLLLSASHVPLVVLLQTPGTGGGKAQFTGHQTRWMGRSGHWRGRVPVSGEGFGGGH